MRILFVKKNGPFSILQENELTDLTKIFTENCWQSAVQVVTILFAFDIVIYLFLSTRSLTLA